MILSDKVILSLFVLVTVIFTSCDNNRIFDEYKKIDNNIWEHDNPLTFEIDIQDTISLCNLYINIRHTESYKYSNMYVLLKSTQPNNISETDTLEFILADPDGKWKGKSSGTIVLSPVIRRARNFPRSGKYIFELTQAMIDEKLSEVTDIGVRVERVN